MFRAPLNGTPTMLRSKRCAERVQFFPKLISCICFIKATARVLLLYTMGFPHPALQDRVFSSQPPIFQY